MSDDRRYYDKITLYIQMMQDSFLHFFELIHIWLFTRTHIHISFWICRDQVIVTVWYLIAKESRTDPLTPCCPLNSWGEFFCCLKYGSIVRFWYISKMIHFALWYDECMTRCLRKYIEKCKNILILVDFEGRDFSGDDFWEKRGHRV